MNESFEDRRDAGRRLAEALDEYRGAQGLIVLGLARGGVPVAFEVARALDAPLDVMVVRKLGAPGQPELAMGAIALGGVRVLNERVVRNMHISEDAIERAAAREQEELRRREQTYRGERALPSLSGRTVILVDDGLATGATMRAAVQAVRTQQPARVVVAVPVGAPNSCAALADVVDDVVCAFEPAVFFGVGGFYHDFEQTSDDEVRDLLALRHVAQGEPRDDREILRDLCQRLTHHQRLDASDVEVHVADGVVRLTGQTDSDWTRRMAEDVARQIVGVRRVENDLSVDHQRGKRDAARALKTGRDLGASPKGDCS